MAWPNPTVADIVRADARQRLGLPDRWSTHHQRVLRDLASCRTAVLGGHSETCDRCPYTRVLYNSCRNRHCPLCRSQARSAWLAARQKDLLPVPYYHGVFTVPPEIARIALVNQREVYGLLLRAVGETLTEVAAEPRYLGAQIGALAILHTWGQQLLHHPHVHCVIPAGGLRGENWVPSRGKRFLLPVKLLSAVFRSKILSGLRRAYGRGRIKLDSRLGKREEARKFTRLLHTAGSKRWTVYLKPPFGGPAVVLKYLARYSHGIAISNSRLLSSEAGKVRFSWKDYRDDRKKVQTLETGEFVRRFLLHVLPPGFQKVRYIGFFSNPIRKKRLETARQALGARRPAAEKKEERASAEAATERALRPCPLCHEGRMAIFKPIARLTFLDFLVAWEPGGS